MTNPYNADPDLADGAPNLGVNLDAHATGNPIRGGSGKGIGAVTSGHTWIIIVGALALMWLLGAGAFKSIRM